MQFRFISMALLSALMAACGTPANAPTGSTGTTLPAVTTSLGTELLKLAQGPVVQIVAAGQTGNKAQAKQGFDAFEASWLKIEDQVKQQSPASYQAIEAALNGLQDAAVRADTVQPAAVQAQAVALTAALTAFAVQAK